MAQITVTNPQHVPQVTPDTLPDTPPHRRTLPELLIKLGQKLIEHGRYQESDNWWLSLADVTKCCREYKLYWERGTPRIRDLQFQVEDYFAEAGEVRGPGVKVEGDRRWSEKKRRYEMFLHFVKLYPDGSCH